MKDTMSRTRSDSGFALIEVVVSAAVLAMISLAILAGIDGASASSGREKARNVAASLAEADQERLRALPVTTLAYYAQTAANLVPDPAPAGPPWAVANPAGTSKSVDGVTYQVLSKVQEVGDDTSSAVSCTTDSHAAEYFHITSTVTSAIVGTRVPAQTIDSIAAPNVAYSSTKGTLAVQVLNAAGEPVVGKDVSVTGGTPPPSAKTNALGCAVFQQVTTTTGGVDYTGGVTGCIDQFGNTPSGTDKVYPGRVTTITLHCDAPSTLTASVYTYAPGSTPASPGTKINSAAAQVSVVNSDPSWLGVLHSYPPTAGAETFTKSLTNLFPFPTNYTAFTGNCHYNDPTDPGYSAVNTTGQNATLIAGQQVLATAGGATVVQPPLNVQIMSDSTGGTPSASMTVIVKPAAPSGDSCAQPTLTLSTFNVGTTSSPKWFAGRSYNASNQLDAGVPFGRYTVCFEQTRNRKTYSWTPASYPNAGSAATDDNPNNNPDAYDNTTPPTGQANTEAFTNGVSWPQSRCAR